MALNDFYEASFFCTHQEQASVTRRWWQERNTLGTGTTTSTFANILGVNVGATLKALLSINAQYRGVIVKKMTPLPPSVGVVNIANQGFGPTAGDTLPRQVRGIITLNTASAGRRWRGRIYTPFPGEASNDLDATPVAAYVTSLGALGLNLSTPFVGVGAGGNTADFHPVMVQVTRDQFGNITNIAYRADIITHIARDRWATQRRSGTYGRANSSPI